MTRCFVNQFADQQSIDAVFVASAKQLRPNRNGNLYLQVELSDRTGSISARMWNANEDVYKSFENGGYVRVQGTAQMFQGAMQLIATRVRPVDKSDVDEADFTPESPVEVDRLTARLGEMLRGMTDPALRNLADCFLLDESFMDKFTRAPAGVKNHHAYPGGLLHHVVTLMELVLKIGPCYPQIDRDLLLTGAFLHDIGKVDELCFDRDIGYTDEGQLLGHLVMAVAALDAKTAEAEKLSGEPIPRETVLRLKHMLISHHGEYEYGSPKLPMTLEAVALSFLDNLDAKINSFEQLMSDDPNTDSAWTHYHPNIGRKLFKGKPAE